MYLSNQYSSSSSSGPPHPPARLHPQPPPPGYDRYDAYPPPPPPPSSLPPPPPPPSGTSGPSFQSWDRRDGRDGRDRRDGRDGRDNYFPRDRTDGHRFRGPYSDLRQPSGSYRDGRDGRDSRGSRESRDARESRDYRNSRDEYRPPRAEFTFRQEAPPGVMSDRSSHYPRYDSHGPVHRLRQRRGSITDTTRSYDDRGPSSYGPRRDDSRRSRNQQRRPGQYQRREREKAVDRLLLSKRFDDEGELMLGDTAVRATYRDVDELSDSDEVDMDISDNENDNGNENDGSDSNTADRPAKRARTDAPALAAKKWSNPDPYDALPPPESTRKKDVVQLIRKARVEAEAKKPAVAAEAADFISCDFSEDDDDEPKSQALNGAAEYSRPDAPKGPRVASSTLPPKPPIPTSQLPEKVQTTQLQSHPPARSNPAKPTPKNELPVDLTPSTSLGSRKRTIDDEIKVPHTLLNVKKVNRMPAGGSIAPVWQPLKDSNPCPWAVDDHSGIPNMGARLHHEIRDFYAYVSPRDFEEKLRQQLISKLEVLVRKKWPNARVLPFGSFMSGLYLPTADMDIAICSQDFINGKYPIYDKKKFLYHMKYHLEIHKVAFRDTVEPIAKAKVPLLKYTDDYTGLKVDISFEKMDGYKAIDTFRKWKAQYPAMPPIVAIIKHFLLMRSLNEPVNGGIGGFSVICMVVHVLQMMPQIQSGSMKDDHLGQVLMQFLDYYGNLFNYKQVAITMDPPGTVNKAKGSTVVYRNLDRLSIIDPNNPENDIAGGSSNFDVIKACFAKAYKTLQQTMMQFAKEPPTSSDLAKNTLLYPLFAGNYAHFEDQRNWLQKLDLGQRSESDTA
ncbi:hypothetical protein F5Y09DRAFT_322091 [Xylaria sp. FL1042]|nr:hypothetical protein F5Y09DRAFT_322091 [Xylaria sp. FL1042]